MATQTQATDRIATRYQTWRDNNPEVYDLFVKFAREVSLVRGRYSIDAITNRVRWEVNFEWNEEFKINDHYEALIARDLMADGVVPQGFFETRVRRSVA